MTRGLVRAYQPLKLYGALLGLVSRSFVQVVMVFPVYTEGPVLRLGGGAFIYWKQHAGVGRAVERRNSFRIASDRVER